MTDRLPSGRDQACAACFDAIRSTAHTCALLETRTASVARRAPPDHCGRPRRTLRCATTARQLPIGA